ncbi:16S rRNA (cytosine(967)-C(5))-methyltransferase RsmB [Serpentinicella alkaliphila]|uniref:16S rRNA (cytosine(967)-C(5))-methyltransferase n=1 Tax=Serpentinicella alkaliphila TaxID=1734049 RepID=A0A4R2THE6_9FIRM|nr:16S rRNA (cytosine(967)-C(5))-methyltransferase RsmB [Serpentinicella alkaliphila]QUH26217.1 16S rRNA (cytosine(967)-C(5))-methyltransferase RsmB [Serpentinicella alkaliphila]TCQ01677.1 NusB antitermination factor [Serpentinicella alkaliphila]
MKDREIALKILHTIDSKGAYSNLAINKELKDKNISNLDRGFITELVYGTLENNIYIDYVIEKFSTTKLNKINLWTINILRLGIYQIMFLDKVPDFAAVNESVNLAKKFSTKTSGFTNAILRNVLRNKEKIELPDKQKDFVKYLSVKYSHAEWMVKRFMSYFTKEFTEDLFKANNERPDLYLRINTLKTNIEACIKSLEEKNIEVKRNDYIEEAITVKGINQLDELEEFKLGHIHVQDFGSMLVSRVLNPKEGEYIIDVCCAPGGKTTHMAQLMNNNGKILARDIYDHKLKLVKDNSKRLGVTIIETEVFDGMKLDEGLIEKADKVLVDAPCSGLGIIRRKPEIKYRKKADDLKELRKMQLSTLHNAAKYVKIGGELIYSTCTIDPNENESVIEEFLKEKNDYKLVAIEGFDDFKRKDGTIQLYPNIHNTDGFYIARLKRV